MTNKVRIWFRIPDSDNPADVTNARVDVHIPMEDLVLAMNGAGGLRLNLKFVPTHQILLLEELSDDNTDS
jgi:hypothetical protein